MSNVTVYQRTIKATSATINQVKERLCGIILDNDRTFTNAAVEALTNGKEWSVEEFTMCACFSDIGDKHYIPEQPFRGVFSLVMEGEGDNQVLVMTYFPDQPTNVDDLNVRVKRFLRNFGDLANEQVRVLDIDSDAKELSDAFNNYDAA